MAVFGDTITTLQARGYMLTELCGSCRKSQDKVKLESNATGVLPLLRGDGAQLQAALARAY